MADISRRPSEDIPSRLRSRAVRGPRSWLVGLDYLFYVLVALVIVGVFYYFYSYNHLLLLYLPVFLRGTLVTLIISLISAIFAIVFGFIGAMGRLSRFPILRWLATGYVEVIRGTPVLVQLLLWYYGVGFVLSNIGFDPYSSAFQFMTVLQGNSLVPDAFNGYFYGIIGLSFNYGAYLTEVFRSGIESVDKGQTEAALSLGLHTRQIMRHIVLPQAIRITVPPFTNNFITLIQDSALLSVLAVIELEHETYALALPQIDANNKLFVFVFGALFYLILCYPLSLFARYFESRFAAAY
jgi:His/Glu/Gln/Arg/opine family amino acid ABC transporter permease subunit